MERLGDAANSAPVRPDSVWDTWPQIVGGALVLSGVGLAHRQRHPEEEANI
jgi:hypothetical protein